jgi:hypothetical protein
MTAADYRKSVMQSLHCLRQLAARQGDPEAVKALRDIGLKAASILGNLTIFPDTDETPEVFRDGAAVAKQVAKESSEWPVAYHAISEIRKDALAQTAGLNVGILLGVRLPGKAREFSYNSQTGFALDIFLRLEEVRLNPASHFHITKAFPDLLKDDALPEYTWQNLAAELLPLSTDSLPLWIAAGVELCRDECQDDWDTFPWPEIVKNRLTTNRKKAPEKQKGADGQGNERSCKSAVRDKIQEGLKLLILKARPEKRQIKVRT